MTELEVWLAAADDGAVLAGENEAHFAAIESALGGQLALDRDRISVRHPAHDGASAIRRVLEGLIVRLRDQRAIDHRDVKAEIERARTPVNTQLSVRPAGKPNLVQSASAGQKLYLEALKTPGADLVFAVGPAGTGKTFLACAVAVEALTQGLVERIIVARPAVEAGERLGFLPGDMNEKVDPYLQPIWDAFRLLLSQGLFERKRDTKEIEVAPLAFLRGRTLTKAFVIIDEAQNATVPQMKMVLTRLGRESRMVVTGDVTQIDLPRHQQSGLGHAVNLLEGVPGVRVVRLSTADVQRHDLVARIIEAYDGDETAG